jgi:hypothetical protein
MSSQLDEKFLFNLFFVLQLDSSNILLYYKGFLDSYDAFLIPPIRATCSAKRNKRMHRVGKMPSWSTLKQVVGIHIVYKRAIK